MLFSSPEFLFAFFPFFILIYFSVKDRQKNAVLLAASIFFYFSTSGELTLILLVSILFNYFISHRIYSARAQTGIYLLFFSIVANLVPLFYYKYSIFFIEVSDEILQRFGFKASFGMPSPILPIGISFFTFQAISYVIDIYQRRVPPARSIIDFGMYHSCFPQLIAGPIVRYEEIESEVHRRNIKLEDLYNGFIQFGFGLAKKVILADNMGSIADPIFNLPTNLLSPTAAWCGAVAYTLQIYFDFSGYSDMAIGLGRVLGFHYPENFNQPYLSVNVTDFWRRWHMTLSRWFRDYLYIPLGGNRGGLFRTLLNLQTVFLLCGLWHGAGYTFIFWGFYHGVLLTLERVLGRLISKYRSKSNLSSGFALCGWFYTLIVVIIGWVIFRCGTLHQAFSYVACLFGIYGLRQSEILVPIFTTDKRALMAIAILFSIMPFQFTVSFVNKRYFFTPLFAVCSLFLVVVAMAMMAVNGFSPFIYFRF